jgi:ribosomal protein L37AE/L43A
MYHYECFVCHAPLTKRSQSKTVPCEDCVEGGAYEI